MAFPGRTWERGEDGSFLIPFNQVINTEDFCLNQDIQDLRIYRIFMIAFPNFLLS